MNKNIRKNVKKLLDENPGLRDNNVILGLAYHVEVNKIDRNTPYEKIIELMHFRKIPTFDCISRMSRSIQQQHPTLRGLNWEKRQQNQKNVLEQLGYCTSTFHLNINNFKFTPNYNVTSKS